MTMQNTDLHLLPQGATLLAPSYLHPFLRQQLLHQNQGVFGITLHSPTTLQMKYATKEAIKEHTLLFLYRSTLKPIMSNLTIYQKTALSSVFLKACIQFIEDMKQYHLTPADLPTNTEAQTEIRYIIQTLFPIETNADILMDARTIMKDIDFSNVYIYDAFTTMEDEALFQFLCEHGATRLKGNYEITNKQFYHAVNKRQEIEACAQYIIQHDLNADDIHITLADSTYAPIVSQIFQRYEIPYTLLSDTHASILVKRCIALFTYYLEKDIDSLFACIDCKAFPQHELRTLSNYLEIFPGNITEPFTHLSSLTHTSHIVNLTDIENLQRLQITAEDVRQMYIDTFLSITHPTSYESLCTSIFQQLEMGLHNQASELSMYTKLQSMIEDIFSYIQDDEDIRFLLPILDTLTQSGSVKQLHGAIVTTLTQSATPRPYQFILGATQKNYPAFSFKKGIFDERYYEHIPYPKMEDRYAFYLTQIDKQLRSSSNVIISYPLGTYEGKAQEAALEIEQFMDTPSNAYPLQTSYEQPLSQISISPVMAEQLFLHDGRIKGSISSLERYIRCPYAYFLRYGLSLREPMTIGFDNSYMGTLSHFILETLVDQLGKDYTKACEDTIEHYISQEIQALQEVFPNIQDRLESLQTRISTSLIQTLQRLDETEAHSHLKPWKQEEEFTFDIPVENGIALSLHGFIDRIDADGSLACILDYKSSAKTLSETKVFAALQLQLLTYAIVIKRMYRKDILGTYYISLKNENITQDAGKLSRRKPVTYTPIGKEEMQDLRKKAHRMNGWSMHPSLEVIDDDATHITGVRMNKDGLVTTSKLYNIEKLEEHFITMYQKIAKRILQGNFSCTPSEDACLFCSYHEICRFKGLWTQKEALVEVDDTIYYTGKGEDEDA